MSILCAVTHRKEEAARKWCPFTWTRNNACAHTAFPCGNNPSEAVQQGKNTMPIHSRCLTSRCMAWIDETDYYHGITLGRCGLVGLSRM